MLPQSFLQSTYIIIDFNMSNNISIIIRSPGPSKADLQQVFLMKHGEPESTGWSPRLRYRFGYFTSDDIYEATVANLVHEQCSWIDIGCGRDLFPTNRRLSRLLVDRCRILVGLDPDETLEENPFVHERVKCAIEDYRDDRTFDLITLRMVAEHLTDPGVAVRSLARLTRPGGKVVIYTVNRWCPVSILAPRVPFGLHHPIKRIFWGTEEKDTFPVAYRMNTRDELGRLFREGGFTESSFHYLDDCRTLSRFWLLNLAELCLWHVLRAVGLRYPENCLLGVYERVDDQPTCPAPCPEES